MSSVSIAVFMVSSLGCVALSAQASDDEAGPTSPDVWSTVSAAGEAEGAASHTCAVRVDSTLWCWGDNASGQLGLGGTRTWFVPARVGSDADWASVSAGWTTTCAVTLAGQLWCWGQGYTDVPQQVGTDTDWARVSVGDGFQCALRTEGSLWCWGYNGKGQLGLGDRADRSDPTQVGTDTDWSTVSLGQVDACATKAAGTAWCWGQGLDGQLGLGDDVWDVKVPTQVGTSADWSEVSVGTTFTCGVQSDATGYCWGRNDRGQLGTGDHVEQTTPAPVSTGSWQSISAGAVHACATATDGSMWCWGANDQGQLGDGSTSDHDSPTPVQASAFWGDPGTGAMDSCGVQSDHSLWCWGSPESGELGVGSRTTNTTVPVQVGLPNPPPSEQSLYGVDALSAADAWAVGDEVVGTTTLTRAEHWDGSDWTRVKTPSPGKLSDSLEGVSGSSPSDVWAVGQQLIDGTYAALIEHWDGGRWRVVPCPTVHGEDTTLASVVAVSADSAWAVGSADGGYLPIIEHWDGSTWTQQQPDWGRFSWFGLESVDALSPTNVWAVGSGFVDEEAGWLTITEHWNGVSWTVKRTEHHNRFADHFFHGVTAVAHRNVWAVGDELHGKALIEHWTGSWVRLGEKVPQVGGMELEGAASTAADDVWAVGQGAGRALALHWDGTAWTVVSGRMPEGAEFRSVSSVTATDAWAVGTTASGTSPLIEHWDGSGWSKA